MLSAKTFSRLLLVRSGGPRKNENSTLVQRAGVTQFLKGEPLLVSPQKWDEEAGISHYGYALEGMKLQDLDALKDFAQREHDNGVTLQDYDGDVEAALAAVGLRPHPAA